MNTILSTFLICAIFAISSINPLNMEGLPEVIPECKSFTDPMIETFDGYRYQFHYEGDHYIMYDDFKETRVTSSYHSCAENSTCNCAVYLKKRRSLVFMDFCTATSPSSPTSAFYTVSSSHIDHSIDYADIKAVPKCDIILPGQEDNEQVWKQIKPFESFFKCARIQGKNNFETYVLRTVERHFDESVKVKVTFRNQIMPTIAVSPSIISFDHTGGLCGLWNNNVTSDLYVLDKEGYINTTDLSIFKEFWKMNSKYGKTGTMKRSPSDFLKGERNYYCPCDEFNLFEQGVLSSRTSYCQTSMSQCVEKAMGAEVTAKVDSKRSFSSERAFTHEDAVVFCTDSLMNNTALETLINMGMLDATFNIEACAASLVTTGDPTIVDVHIPIGIDDGINNVIEELTNNTSTSNTTTDFVSIDDILCPGGICPQDLCAENCNNHGVCTLIKECIGQTTEECYSPIACDCEDPWTGETCEINNRFPEITLNSYCCDLRDGNCSTIVAKGSGFDKSRDIYARITLFETLINGTENRIEEYITFKASNSDQIIFNANRVSELNLFKNIFGETISELDRAEATVQIALGYQPDKASVYSVFTLYDSLCRECDEPKNSLKVENSYKTVARQDSCEENGVCFVCPLTTEPDTTEPDTTEPDTTEPDTTEPDTTEPDTTEPDTTEPDTTEPEINYCHLDTHTWTEWVNIDDPEGDGDLELLALNPLCQDSQGFEVLTVDGQSLEEVGQVIHKDDCFGFICLNKEQAFNETCLDYKIRQCCPYVPPTTTEPAKTTTRPTTTITRPTTTTTRPTTTTEPTTTTTPIRECTEEENLCGAGAICEIINESPWCSCKPGAIGDPYERCCDKPLTCSCWGDPHCTTFDGAKYDFMGACKYDLVSTDCYNNTLAEGLVPFNVRQKHTTRGSKTVSFVDYLEVNVYGNQYRLLNKRQFTVNGNLTATPFANADGTVQVFIQGSNIVLSTDFGLTVKFDGDHRHSLYLCDAYANSVCGLCGNADGDRTLSKEFVDRNNEPVAIQGGRLVKYFKWGSAWRTPTDDASAIDIDGSSCLGTETNTTNIPESSCVDEALYQNSQSWCAILSNKTGPWAECLAHIEPYLINEVTEACVFDMCAFENDPKQNEVRCQAYEELNAQCLELADNMNLNASWTFDWRQPTNCLKECGENEVFGVRDECPKTCLHLDGDFNCGDNIKAEGCYCKEGYVTNFYGKCVLPEQCNDVLPECPYEIGFDGEQIMTVNEADGSVTVFVEVDQGLDCDFKERITVDFAVKSYTAKEGVDFNVAVGSQRQITFDVNSQNRRAAIKINIVDDNLIESYEFFSVDILNSDARKVIYIEDNDYYTGIDDIQSGYKDYFNYEKFAEYSINPHFIDEFNSVVTLGSQEGWDMCPDRGGITLDKSQYRTRIETLSDDIWIWKTIEVHNPTKCNLKSFTLQRFDMTGFDSLDQEPIQSIYLKDSVAIIDIEYVKAFSTKGHLLTPDALLSEVYLLLLDFLSTKDNSNTVTSCEFRGFGHMME